MDLTKKKCLPCDGETPVLEGSGVKDLLGRLKLAWEVVDGKKIKMKFKFKDFRQSIEFVNRVADLAESEAHHPNIKIYYNKVVIELTTHVIGGLSENDFILASKIEAIK